MAAGRLSKLQPGRRVVLRYDEDLWHERLLCWPVDRSTARWVVLTPDDDMYEEWLIGGEASQYRTIPLGARRPAVGGLRMHAFAESLDEAALLRVYQAGRREAEDIQTADGLRGEDLSLVHCWDGEEVELSALATARSAPLAPVPPAGGGRAASVGPLGGLSGDGPGDEIWVLAEDAAGATFGQTVMPSDPSQVQGSRAVTQLRPGDDDVIFCRRMRPADVPAFVARSRPGPPGGGAAPAGAALTVENEVGDDQDDARTLDVAYDDQGERWRPWRSVVQLGHENYYEDWPVEGPRTLQWLLKHIERTAGSPMQWYHRFLVESRISPTDRTAYEIQSLARMLEVAGSYDQLNLPSVAAFEILARRWQLLLDANSRDPGDSRFEDEDLWAGSSQKVLGIAPALSAHVASKTKEKAEMEKQRQSAKDLRLLQNGVPAAGPGAGGVAGRKK